MPRLFTIAWVAASVFALGCGGRARVVVPFVPVKAVGKVRVRAPVNVSVKTRVKAWKKISSATEGRAVESQAPEDLPELITGIFNEDIPDGPADVVFVVDTTGSMSDDIDAVKGDMRKILEQLRARNPDYRVGVVAYRDIHDEFLTRTHLFLTADDERIERAIAGITVKGGDDWPEHVYAGINTALDTQPWRPNVSQHILLMGDAPPHEDYGNDPRNYELVTHKARTAPLHVRIHTIGIKCDSVCEEALRREREERENQRNLQL